MPKLTKRVVDAATPHQSAYFIPCSELPGFKVRVFPSGARSYILDYYSNGTRHKMTIGRHGVLTVDQARKIALEKLGDVARGKNPMQERMERRQALTVHDLCAEYFEAAADGRIIGRGGMPKKSSTLANDRVRVDRHILPLIGGRRVRDLRPADIVQMRDDIAAGKTARGKKSGPGGGSMVVGGDGVATRTVRTLGGIMGYAVQRGHIDASPTRGVQLKPDKSRDRRLTPDEYRLLGGALDKAPSMAIDWRHITGARLTALTGWRLSEVEKVRWDALDLENKVARLADTKSGRSVRPLSSAATSVLRSIPRHGLFVFPGLRDSTAPYDGLDRGLDMVLAGAAAGLERFTAQTLRHSFNSVGADLGIPREVRKLIIGQRIGGDVNDGYTHHMAATLIDAADKIAVRISGWLEEGV